MPSAFRSGWPKRHLMLRQNWMGASENVWLRPRLPLGWACHCMFLSSQTDSDPLAFSAALYCAQFVVRFCLPAVFFSHVIASAYERYWGDLDLC